VKDGLVIGAGIDWDEKIVIEIYLMEAREGTHWRL
jgi:hypothetical protein